MQQFINLCEYLNKFELYKSASLIYDIILDKLNYNLDLLDQNYLFNLIDEFKFDIKLDQATLPTNGHTNSSLIEICQFLIALIHKVCLRKQNEHLNDIFNEKKKYIKSNYAPFNLMLIKHSVSTQFSPSSTTKTSNHARSAMLMQRSNTVDHTNSSSANMKPNPTKSNRFLNFLFARNTKKNDLNLNFFEKNTKNKISSKRKAIFNRIVAGHYINSNNIYGQKSLLNAEDKQRFKNSQEIRQLWKKAISEQVILLKMEKENQNMATESIYSDQDSDNDELNSKNYVEITPCLKQADLTWNSLLLKNNEIPQDQNQILDLVLGGVPQHKRNQIWLWLVENSKIRVNRCNAVVFVAYDELIKQTTIHQHAIILDLGRTFPTHGNFSKKFGQGQYALFNVLKAYSILDHEVGYCQGRTFFFNFNLFYYLI
jgi:hypothetical protein